MLIKLFSSPLTVDKEYTARLNVINHLVTLDYVRGVVASNEVSLVDIVRTLNWLIAKTEVRNCDTTGLLRVILEVCLYILVGVVTDNLDRVFVSTNSTVTAETPELTLDCTFSSSIGSSLFFE